MIRQAGRKRIPEGLIDRCLGGYLAAGTLDLSLDDLAARAGTSKRMLVHYFGGREGVELRAVNRMEEQLRAQFAPDSLPARWTPRRAVLKLWEEATSSEKRGALLLIMDLGRRAWSGSQAAREFYDAQQQLWIQLLLRLIPDRRAVEELFVVFEGAMLTYLISGDERTGRRALLSVLARVSRIRRR